MLKLCCFNGNLQEGTSKFFWLSPFSYVLVYCLQLVITFLFFYVYFTLSCLIVIIVVIKIITFSLLQYCPPKHFAEFSFFLSTWTSEQMAELYLFWWHKCIWREIKWPFHRGWNQMYFSFREQVSLKINIFNLDPLK